MTFFPVIPNVSSLNIYSYLMSALLLGFELSMQFHYKVDYTAKYHICCIICHYILYTIEKDQMPVWNCIAISKHTVFVVV